MQAEAGLPLALMKADGGASVMDVLMQFQADLLGVPVVRPEVQETTALGAAYLAGLAEGVWPTLDAISTYWKAERTFEPQERAETEARYEGWRRAVERSLGWASPEAGG
jgi:glycerol kinase